MNADQWDYIQHFHAGENWGDWTCMDFQFIRILDTVRHLANTPFELTSPAYTKRTGHSKQSFHYLGRAADFTLPKKKALDAYDLLVLTLEEMGIYNKVGFGFYPGGNFFHLDDRAMHPGVQYKPGVVWVRPNESRPTFYLYGHDALAHIRRLRQNINQ